MRKFTILLTILLAIAAVLAISACGNDSSDTSQAVAKTSSNYSRSTSAGVRERFELYDVNGNLRRWSEFAGKPLVLNFWATWCGPCRHEIPLLKKLYEDYRSEGLEIIGISVDQAPAMVKPFVDRVKIGYPILYADGKLVSEFKLGGSIPFTIFFYPDGTESARITGARPESSLRAEIEKIMN